MESHGPQRTSKFIVDIDGREVPGWQSITLPGSSTEVGEYREGNSEDHMRKLWGANTYDDLEMERGCTHDDTEIWDWRQEVIFGEMSEARVEVVVTLLNEDNDETVRYEFVNAWPSAYDPPDLDASVDGEVATESVTVSFDRMKREET